MTPTAAERDRAMEAYRRWDICCPVCHKPAGGFLLLDQSDRLARHLLDVHPFELRFLEITVDAARRREGLT